MVETKRVLNRTIFSTTLVIIVLLGLSSCNTKTTKVVEAKKPDSSLIVLDTPVPLSQAETDALHEGCETWYRKALPKHSFNGGILVAKKGNIVFEDYEGTGHLKGKDTVNAATPFHIASVSKTFTAMAVLKFWQDGKLNIDDEFSKYFPQFNYPGVTIRSLLNHRSGLPNYVYFMETLGWDKTKFIHNQDILDWMVTRKAELTNIASPNTHFTYCNTNYALLALLLEKVGGMKLPQLLQKIFFEPLQMKSTFVFDSSMIDKVNPSYDWRGRIIPFNFLDAVYGDKNVYTTARDLLTWDRVLNSNKIFSANTLAAAYTPYSNEKRGVRNYGLGWRMNIFPDGKKVIYHNGWWHGNNASFIRLTQDSATIILVSNKFNKGVYHAKDMANLFSQYGGSDEEEENVGDPNKEGGSGGVGKAPVAKKASPAKRHPKRKKHHPKNK